MLGLALPGLLSFWKVLRVCCRFRYFCLTCLLFLFLLPFSYHLFLAAVVSTGLVGFVGAGGGTGGCGGASVSSLSLSSSPNG